MPRSRRFREVTRRVAARLRALRADDGSASLEFVTVGMLLLVPTVYLVITLSALESATFGVEGAARQATRVFVQSSTGGEAEAAARTAIDVTLADYGLRGSDATVRVTCRPNPADCLTRRGFVTVSVTARVPLPLLPPVLHLNLPDGIPVQSIATEQVSRFWGGR